MKITTIALATAFALSGTIALAQTNMSGNPSPSKSTGEPAMKKGNPGMTTGTSAPSPKDASTQGAGTAGAADKKGDAASPGGVMKK